MRVLLMGNSHLAAVERAGTEMFSSSTDISWSRFSLQTLELGAIAPRENGRIVLHPEIAARLDWVGNDGCIFLFLAGNAHDKICLAEHPVPFDFVSPERPDLPVDPSRTLVPSQAIVQRIERINDGRISGVLEGLRAKHRGMVFQFESPAPVPSEAHIRAYPRAFAAAIDQYGVAPAHLRFKLWLVNCRTTRRVCDSFGVQYLTVPEESLDPDGFLLPAFWDRDPNHANALYGRLVLEKIERTLRGLR
jgi:predicted transcriptional regulator